ncbi:hypothetical protein [Nocardia cyriacigeorgica]|uniref:hypothetical protein n=1 Tax=Nocardia cyriacigeorgica TaxID=135487 RepID=UPI00130DB78D|nr:hypothetical protein [Nocardia cyriacigeorgica]MBF6289153.1 hypothetical protein [Nocardia cyriacigeorgica]
MAGPAVASVAAVGWASAAAMAAFNSAMVAVASAMTRSNRVTMARISVRSGRDGGFIALSCSA